MHDDDEETFDEVHLGKVFHSGIGPESNVQRADYALPPGVPALQDEPIGDDDVCAVSSGATDTGNRGTAAAARDTGRATSRVPLTRRRVLAFGLGGLVFGTGAFGLGRLTVAAERESSSRRHRMLGTRLTQRQLKRIQDARIWASGSIETLVQSAPVFLWVFHVIEPDDSLLWGLRRLCDYARVHGDDERGYETAATILGAFDGLCAPELDSYRRDLQDVVWRWQARKRSEEMPR